jgi:hypothetical protein
VRLLVAAVIALSVCSLQAHALAFHVHAAAGRAHSEHHHGPAIHHHDDIDGAAHVDADESSERGSVITIGVPVALVTASAVSYAEPAQVFSAPELAVICVIRTIDVRSHSPPQSRTTFLRGPPSFTHS